MARTDDGATLTPVIVNGWQQGWVLPAGAQGRISVTFPSNTAYRAGLATGLALLPGLLLLALIPARRTVRATAAPRPWQPRVAAAVGTLAAGTLLGGIAGAAVFGAALAAGALLRHRDRLRDRLTLAVVPVALIAAGALLSRYPWRSVDGYIGHSPWVQLPALIAVGVLTASAVIRRPARPRSP